MAAIVTKSDQKANVGAYSIWGVAADVFLKTHGQAFQKSPELHVQPQVKYPKFQPETPKCGWLWQMIQWTRVNSGQLSYLFKCDSVTIPQPHIKLMGSNYMPLLYTYLAKYTPCQSPTPKKSNMASTWSGLSWQTKRAQCRHNLLVGRGLY